MLQLKSPSPDQIPGKWTAENEARFQALRLELGSLLKSGLDSPQGQNAVQEKGLPYWLGVYREYEHLRFAKLRIFLRKREPDSHVGYSILIYELSDEEVQTALATKRFE